jgi:hypothetical protein
MAQNINMRKCMQDMESRTDETNVKKSLIGGKRGW